MMKTTHRQTLTQVLPFILAFLLLAQPGSAALVFMEGFETDGEGTRYTVQEGFSDGADDYFIRTDGLTGASGIPAYTGFLGDFFWAAEDTITTDNPGGKAILEFSGINLQGLSSFFISIDIGAGSQTAFDSIDDFVNVDYRFDGGSWMTALSFQNDGQTSNAGLWLDSDLDGIGDTGLLGLELQTISSGPLAAASGFIDLRIDTVMTGGDEAIAFDNLAINGIAAVPEPATTVLFVGAVAAMVILRRRFLQSAEKKSRT